MATIEVPRPFSFRLMLISHGWLDLEPFRWDDSTSTLEAALPLADDRAVAIRITSLPGDRQTLRIDTVGKPALSRADRAAISRRVGWMFRLDEDFSGFHRECRKSAGLKWVARFGLGAFLRNPSWFEEFVKVLLTTNVSWAGTRLMTSNLVRLHGVAVDGVPDRRAFPPASVLAGLTETELRREARVGYRAPYILELAERVASGDLDLDELARSDLPTEELARELSRIKGFGDYAVNALLMSLGRYERIILDSWIRRSVAKRYFKSPRISDRTIHRWYRSWGSWRTLACWFDCAHETWLEPHLRDESRRWIGLGMTKQWG